MTELLPDRPTQPRVSHRSAFIRAARTLSVVAIVVAGALFVIPTLYESPKLRHGLVMRATSPGPEAEALVAEGRSWAQQARRRDLLVNGSMLAAAILLSLLVFRIPIEPRAASKL